MTMKRTSNGKKNFKFFVKGKLVFETAAKNEYLAAREFRDTMRNTAAQASLLDLTIVTK